MVRLEWIVPEFAPGLGGHSTIFRLSACLSKLGFRNRFWVLPDCRFRNATEAKQALQSWFTPQECDVEFLRVDDIDAVEGDACIATEHRTAYYAAAVQKVSERFYLIQDYEPWFFPRGADSLVAEETYNLPLKPLAAGRWLAAQLQTHYAGTVDWFSLAFDRLCYHPGNVRRSDRPIVALYLRELTPRRCAELAWSGLEQLAKSVPNLEVHCFGQPTMRLSSSFKCVQHGLLRPDRLAALYQTACVGLVFSSSNQSLIPAEMMACGLPVVELDAATTRMDFPDDALTRVKPHPISIANGIGSLLVDRERWGGQQAAGLAFVKTLDWERSARAVARILRRGC